MGARSWRSRAAGAAAVVLVFAGTTVLTATPSGANHASIFELDGNTADVVADPPAAPWDWTRFFGVGGARITPLPDGFLDSGFDADYTFPDPSTFTGGSKDTLDVSGWSCANSNNLGGKFDIVNAYSTIYEVPTTGGDYAAGDQLLFFGIERAATEGDGNMGFWFLKDGSVNCEKPPGGGPAPAFTGNHMDGDIFVVASFSNGGTKAAVTAYRWNGGATGSLASTPFVNVNEVCGIGTSHDACGIVNTSPIPTGSGKPWASPDKNGGDLDTNAFYEGFVRVPQDQVSGCFATFVANTRASTSPTATIHDFSRGSFPTCQPSTSLTATPAPDATTGKATKVVVVGDQVTYTFTELNDGNDTLTQVKVVTDNAACNAAMIPQGTVTLEPLQSQAFSCTLTTGATPAVTTIVGIGQGLDSQGRNVTWCAPGPTPANTVCDPEESAVAMSASIEPGTELDVSADPSTAKSGDTVTFTITEKNDGTAPVGYESYLDLTSVDVTTDSTDCNSSKTGPTGDVGADGKLSQNETWTYTCTVTIPSSDDFTLEATGTGTVLAGTDHARVVTYGETCTNVPGTSTTTGTFCDSEEQDSVTVTVIAPTTELTVTASAVITYTFAEKNDSADAPLTPPIAGDRLSVLSAEGETIAQLCNVEALSFTGTDTGTNLVLDPGETWTFQCKGSLAGPTGDTGTASKVATAIGNGKDATGDSITYCAPNTTPADTLCDVHERDRVTVTITNQARGHDPAP